MTDLWKWMERLVFLLSGEKWWWRISSVRSSIAGWTAGDMFSQRARHRSRSLAVHLVSSDRPWLVQMFLTTFSFVAISQEEEGLCLVKVSQYYFIICSNRRGEKDVSVKDYRHVIFSWDLNLLSHKILIIMTSWHISDYSIVHEFQQNCLIKKFPMIIQILWISNYFIISRKENVIYRL